MVHSASPTQDRSRDWRVTVNSTAVACEEMRPAKNQSKSQFARGKVEKRWSVLLLYDPPKKPDRSRARPTYSISELFESALPLCWPGDWLLWLQ